MAVFQTHLSAGDWCHVCGSRDEATADVWYPRNAEHATAVEKKAQAGADVHYIRICAPCASQALRTALGMAKRKATKNSNKGSKP